MSGSDLRAYTPGMACRVPARMDHRAQACRGGGSGLRASVRVKRNCAELVWARGALGVTHPQSDWSRELVQRRIRSCRQRVVAFHSGRARYPATWDPDSALTSLWDRFRLPGRLATTEDCYMLTRRHRRQAAHLMHCYGEPRPGSLQHGAANVTGPYVSPYGRSELFTEHGAGGGPSLELSFQYDAETGEVKFSTEANTDSTK